jgi:hypothetical protein
MMKKLLASFATAIALFLAVYAVPAHGKSNGGDEHEAEAPEADDDRDSDDRDSDDRDSDDRDSDDRDSDDRDSDDRDSDDRDNDDRDSDDRDGDDRDSDDRDDNAGSQDSSGARVTREDTRGSDKASSEGRVARAENYLEIIENSRGERILRGELVLLSARADLKRRLSSKGFKVIETFRMPALGMVGFRIEVPSKENPERALARIKLVDPKGVASFNHVYVPARGGATVRTSTTALLPANGTRTTARIGLVDARVNANHPMLRHVQVSSKSFGVASSSGQEHGTAVASRIAEVAPGANLVVASVFSEFSNGQEMASVDAIAKALNWLSVSNVPVINLSLAGPPNPVLEAATAKLISRGHVLVAAVGNEGPHASPQYPAAYDDVVGVTAVDSDNQVYLYANQGKYVDFAAPGVNTRVATNERDLETVSGTSYAAPVVAAALARQLKQPDPKLARKAERELAKSAQDAGEPGRDPVYGYGIVSIHE